MRIAPYNAPLPDWDAMMFENLEVALEELPRADDVEWQPLDPNLKKLQQLQGLLVVLAAAVPLGFITFVAEIPILPAIVIWTSWVLVLGAVLIWPSIALPRRGYVLRDKDVLFKKGVIWRSVTAIPFNRIQHVETSSTPFDRKFELATLQLFTAGGTGGDLKIDGLAADTAEQLRLFILQKVGRSIENAD
jgi:membrane protein YdbS with pleckstrin-like domain